MHEQEIGTELPWGGVMDQVWYDHLNNMWNNKIVLERTGKNWPTFMTRKKPCNYFLNNVKEEKE